MKRRHPESVEQRLFIKRVRLDPRTKHALLTAVPMGGKRNAREAAILKAEGALAGCPDILCFEVRIESPPPPSSSVSNHRVDLGLALEFKAGNNKTTPSQEWWHQGLRRCGWRVEVVRSAEEAWWVLCNHLGVWAG